MIAKTRAIADLRGLSKSLPFLRYVDPEYVYLPVTNARCATAEVYVKPGDKVKVAQVIGKRNGGFFEQNIHSTVSGEVIGIVKKFHRSGKLVDFIQIKNDFQDTNDESVRERTPEEIAQLTRLDMMQIVKDCSLVGLGGSSFPTYIKFQTEDPIHTICINAVECEPYLSSDHSLVMEYTHRVIAGITYALQAFKAEKAVIAIKKQYTELEEVLTAVINRHGYTNIEVVKVGNYYPQGWEIEMIKSALGVKVPRGTLPSKLGIMNFNVSTIVGLYKAIRYNMPVVKRNFTMTGDGIKFPQNIRVRVGTSLQELVNVCDGYVDDSDKVFILGGPMMGANLLRDDAVISKTVTSAIILNHKPLVEEPCIRCAACVYSCPVGLQPVQIMNATKNKDADALKKLNIKSCIECGLCTYTCTSKIQLMNIIRQGKRMVK